MKLDWVLWSDVEGPVEAFRSLCVDVPCFWWSSVFDVIFCLCDFVVAFHCALLCWVVVGCGLLFFSSI